MTAWRETEGGGWGGGGAGEREGREVCTGSGCFLKADLPGGWGIQGHLPVQHHPPRPGNGFLHDVCAKPPLQLLQLHGLDACRHTCMGLYRVV